MPTKPFVAYVRETASAVDIGTLAANKMTARRIAVLWTDLTDDLDQVLLDRAVE